MKTLYQASIYFHLLLDTEWGERMTDTILTDFSIKIHPFIEQLTMEVIFPRNLLSGLFSLCISKVYALMALLH